MGYYYHYANYTKRERFSIAALGGNVRYPSVGKTLASRAFHLLLVGEEGSKDSVSPGYRRFEGRWAGDSIRIVADDLQQDWQQFASEFADIRANAILLVFDTDGFEAIGDAADDNSLFMELCHLVVTRQALELDPHMKNKFGTNYLRRYKELSKDEFRFPLTDIVN